MSYEYFEHRADIGIRGIGENIKEAFEQVAIALFAIMVEIQEVEEKEIERVTVEGLDYEELLMAWLSELLYLKDVGNKMYSKFRIFKIEETNLNAEILGEKIDLKKHKLKLEVKAATWTQLEVKELNNKWIAQCVVDV